VYRVAQEALTNVVKHATANRVEVHLAYAADHVNLTIEDFGAGSNPVAPAAVGHRTGYGLTGMRERAELLGGALDTAATPAGFRVDLRVPT
jgi:signal transduction histidine kinase